MMYMYTLYDVLQKAKTFIADEAVKRNSKEDKQLLKLIFLKLFPKMKYDIIAMDTIFAYNLNYRRVTECLTSLVSFYRTVDQRIKFKTDIGYVCIEIDQLNKKKSIDKIKDCFLNYLLYLCFMCTHSNDKLDTCPACDVLRPALTRHKDFPKLIDKLGELIKCGYVQNCSFVNCTTALNRLSVSFCTMLIASSMMGPGKIKLSDMIEELLFYSKASSLDQLINIAIKTTLKINPLKN